MRCRILVASAGGRPAGIRVRLQREWTESRWPATELQRLIASASGLLSGSRAVLARIDEITRLQARKSVPYRQRSRWPGSQNAASEFIRYFGARLRREYGLPAGEDIPLPMLRPLKTLSRCEARKTRR